MLFQRYRGSSLLLSTKSSRSQNPINNMKISSAVLPLLVPTWLGTAFQSPSPRRFATYAPAETAGFHRRPANRVFSTALQMESLTREVVATDGLEGEILSQSDMFAVVRARDDSDTAVPAAAASNEEVKEEDRVELAQALFASKPDMVQNTNGGVIADGDLTGRAVTFPNNSQGLVVAHRHPIAFVLLDNLADFTNGASCTISSNLVSINPDSIPAGSTVDYLGRHVEVDSDGTVTHTSTTDSVSSSSRPIFVPIPKISDIGLINTPLVTGITAIDALTPIGKGQNMLVIGNQEENENEEAPSAKNVVNKRAWMLNLLKSVVEKNRSEKNKDGDSKLRCFYALTGADSGARSKFIKRLEKAGIQDEVVSVVSTRSSDGSDDLARRLEAMEAVAVAASACTLGEHHAITTGGDALIIVDDINLHKSLWDITTQQLVEIYGVDAVVKADLQGGSSSEMRGFFSGLIQRAARFNSKKGGGSVTLILMSTLPGDEASSDGGSESQEEVVFDPSDFEAMSEKIKTRIATLVKAKVPLTASNLRKIQIPIPRPSEAEDRKRLALQHIEDLISMSDGQIWFDDDLARMGRSPPLDPSRSITRVGVGADTPCRADAPALRTVAGSLRFQFAQATDVITRKDTSLIIPSGDTKQALIQESFLLAMHQTPNQSRKLSQECISLIAASRGYLDKVLKEGGKAGTPKGKEVMDGLMKFVESEAGDATKEIDETLDMSLENMALIEDAIRAYFGR